MVLHNDDVLEHGSMSSQGESSLVHGLEVVGHSLASVMVPIAH